MEPSMIDAAPTSSHVPDATVDGGVTRYVQHIRVGNHKLVADEPASRGGTDAGPSPYGMLLGALGACTSITLRMYADRKGWELGAVSVELRHWREGEQDRIARIVRFENTLLAEEQLSRLREIAEKTPVTRTVIHGAIVETTLVTGTPGSSQT
jgi:putative redox protein